MYLGGIYKSQFLAIPNAECFVLLCSVVIKIVLICNTSLTCSSDVRCGPKNMETLLSLEKALNESQGSNESSFCAHHWNTHYYRCQKTSLKKPFIQGLSNQVWDCLFSS